MQNCIDKTCCFTGHRHEKCKGKEEYMRKQLAKAIQKAINDGVDTFITGMAPGVDIWGAEEVLKIKHAYFLLPMYTYCGSRKSVVYEATAGDERDT